MESKKLQQLQQANSHLAPMPQTKAPQFQQHGAGDFNTPVFQNHPQYHSITSNFAQINLTNNPHHMAGPGGGQQMTEKIHQTKGYGTQQQQQQHQQQQQQQQHSSGSSGGYHSQYTPPSQQTPTPPQQHPPHMQGHYHGDQIYQSTNNNRERMYQQAPTNRSHHGSHPHTIPSTTRLQQQYQQLQQEKIQLQMKTQNEAIMQQQQTFAMRQQLNPPVPASHFHMTNQPPIPAHSAQQQQQQLQQRSVPPSSLNLTNQFQPAQGPLKLNTDQMQPHYGIGQHQHQINMLQQQKRMQHQNQAMYHQNQQMQQQQQQQQQQQHQLQHGQVQNNMASPNPTQIIIQQNIPGQVVNQACQTQLSGAKGIRSPASSVETPSPHQPLERRKSGPIHSIKSPVTKRPAAPVTVAGWLYKQGSEGLKVWRKRWFVLSEYCLFYYKGPEEEKLLGSVLLPSYKISACLPEDKVYRKFAFKCEHTNMRTYWLAADTAESMVQWVRALTLATMMQGSSESESQPSISSFNHSGGENSDSGIHTFQSQQSKLSVPQGPVTPASDNGGGAQPLYANAPPKPRRANDGGYSSPSPETSIEKYEQAQNEAHRHHQHTSVHNQMLRKADTKSPVPQMESIYGSNNTAAMRQQATKSPDPVIAAKMQQMRLNAKSPNVRAQQTKSPFPAGEAMQQYPVGQQGQQIYGEREMYLQKMLQQQQVPPTAQYHPQQAQGQTQPNMYQQQQMQQQAQLMQQRYPPNAVPYNYQSTERRTPDTYGPPRHGSDRRFSDYEDIYNLAQAQQNVHAGAVADGRSYQRPMSPTAYNPNATLVPNRYTPTHFEPPAGQHVQMRARPAQTMVPRPHSADFLEFEARNPESSRMRPEQPRAPRPKSSLDINRTPDHYYYSEASYAEKMRQSAVYLQKQPSTMPAKVRMSQYPEPMVKQEGLANSVSANTIPRESEFERAQRLGMQDDMANQGVSSVPRVHRSQAKATSNPQDQFLRSASARLPRREEDPTTNNTFRDGEKKPSISVRNVRNIPKNNLTVKPASNNDPQQQQQQHIDASRNQHNQHQQYLQQQNASMYYQQPKGYVKPEVDFETSRSLYAQRNEMQNGMANNSNWSVRKSGSQRELNELEKENAFLMRNLDMSAGDLLNRTHEELILLLIQLRRQNSTTARAIEQCCTDIHDIQNRIRTSDGPAKMENMSRLEQLKQQLVDLEKQYEKSKPLVNLVDNMVKLGSLYRGAPNAKHQRSNESSTLDRLEFNQRVQERRMMQEEKKQWERLSPNQHELQSKVQQLYQLDQLLQEESGTLQSLQRDKEDLERALSGLRVKLQTENQPPTAVEAARRQQHALERELSQVHLLLAENSKKLELTVASNARLEQELLVIRQKLQASRDTRGSQSALGATDSISYGGGATAVLESELRRVQNLVGDMQRQRQELSLAVRQLTENSNNLYQQMNKNGEYTGSHIKKRPSSSAWTETDLDSMISSDPSHNTTPLYIETDSMNSSSILLNASTSSKLSKVDYEKESDGIESSGMESDDLLEGSAFSYLTNQEKQEIKTVRIVKRESERRQRDRERTDHRNGFSSQNLDQVLEEELQHFDAYNNYGRSQSLPRTSYTETHELFHQSSAADLGQEGPVKTLPSPNYSSTMTNKYNNYYNTTSNGVANNGSNHYPVSMIDRKADLYSDRNFGSSTTNNNGFYSQEHDQKASTNNYTNYINHSAAQSELTNAAGLKHKTESIQSLTKTIGELSPVFQSEAARQIIIEMSGNTSEENEKVPSASKQRRAVPKEKRRHYTAPHNQIAKSMQAIQAENDMNKNNVNWRARDDLDMEVALRPRLNAPDVVRSAIGPRDKISENTIDRLLAAPSKIFIPERYIPEQAPELSPEEKKRRQDKVEAIKKMLSETPAISGNGNNEPTLPPSQISAEKKQREHLLQLNQILAQQVMQMSKIVAGNPTQSNQK